MQAKFKAKAIAINPALIDAVKKAGFKLNSDGKHSMHFSKVVNDKLIVEVSLRKFMPESKHPNTVTSWTVINMEHHHLRSDTFYSSFSTPDGFKKAMAFELSRTASTPKTKCVHL